MGKNLKRAEAGRVVTRPARGRAKPRKRMHRRMLGRRPFASSAHRPVWARPSALARVARLRRLGKEEVANDIPAAAPHARASAGYFGCINARWMAAAAVAASPTA